MDEKKPMKDLTVKRYPDRAIYDRNELLRILDDNLFCYVSFVYDNIPFSIPMMYSNRSDQIYLHGSPDSRLIKYLRSGGIFSIEVIKIKGIVIATHIKDNSVNYESVVAIGKGYEIKDTEEKSESFRSLSEKIMKGMWEYYHQPSREDLEKVSVIRIDVDDFSIKIRRGGPKENDPDGRLWSGTLDLECRYANPSGSGNSSCSLPEFIQDAIKMI
ncbi:MAG: pyridoxamine 5'-phosphate oxidase family protein [Thermoplasmata archaeon]